MSTVISTGREEAALREQVVAFGRSLFERAETFKCTWPMLVPAGIIYFSAIVPG
jgi:hypothetical protein